MAKNATKSETIDNVTGEIVAGDIGAVEQTDQISEADQAAAETSPMTSTARGLTMNPSRMNATLASLGFKVKSHVTLPLLKLGASPSIVKFSGEFYEGKEIENPKYESIPIMARVTDMMTGQECELIANTVLLNEMVAYLGTPEQIATFRETKKKYADRVAFLKTFTPHIGKVFALAKQPVAGKTYSSFSIIELDTIG